MTCKPEVAYLRREDRHGSGRGNSQATTQPTRTCVLYDFRVFWQSPRSCIASSLLEHVSCLISTPCQRWSSPARRCNRRGVYHSGRRGEFGRGRHLRNRDCRHLHRAYLSTASVGWNDAENFFGRASEEKAGSFQPITRPRVTVRCTEPFYS
jgi:hypothetical protein